ncbi:MAG: glycosyltransferase family 4 protein [Clostridium sp.]|nr:glycosyltransferase family 4 protein [Clostridium sp.]
MKIAMVTTGFTPVPAVEGGAIENLVETILKEYEKQDEEFGMSILSCYHPRALEESHNYKKTEFFFFKKNLLCDCLDVIAYYFFKTVLHKENLISYRFIFSRVFIIYKYYKFLIHHQYDEIVLVGNSSLFLLLKSRRFRKLYHQKIIYWAHNEVRSFYGCEKYAETIKEIVSVSNFVNASIRMHFKDLKNVPYKVLKNCVNISRLSTDKENKMLDEVKSQYGIDSQDFIIMFTGRISEEKGLLETIKAFNLLREKVSNVKLFIVGGGFYAKKIKSAYEEKITLMIKDNEDIIHTGYISYEKVFDIYRLADVAVLPSMWEEPAGMTMLEMCMMGIPTITTISGGIPEYMNSDCAVLLERDTALVENIVSSILRLKTDPVFYNKLSVNGKAMRQYYNADAFYKNFKCLL